MKRKKLLLVYVDSLRTDKLRQAVDLGKAPNFGKLLDRGTLIPDCVSSFPSVTPVASAEIATGAGADRHWISGMNWYHRQERRYVEYGSSLEASRAFGIFQSLYDLVYNMNLAHLNPAAETIFESLDDAGLRTASTPFLIYRGRHRHPVSLEGLTRRAIDISGLKLNHHTWGPRELFYGDLYASRPVPCQSSSIPGSRDGYAGCCGAELTAAGLCDFLLLGLPDNDHHSHRYGPDASLDSISKADHCFGKVVEAGGGIDGLLEDSAVILLADHAHSAVTHELPLADRLAERWRVLQPSEREDDGVHQLAVSPTSRAANLYRLGSDAPGHEELLAESREQDPGALQCWLADERGRPIERRQPGVSATPGPNAHVRGPAGELRFRPATADGDGAVRDRRGREWQLEGDPEALAASVSEGLIESSEFPLALSRVWEALRAPNAGDVILSAGPGGEYRDWGGSSHVGGGSHGSLHASDSLGPLLFAGCGPDQAEEPVPGSGERVRSGGDRSGSSDPRAGGDQWMLRDVATVIRRHFGTPA